MKRAPVERDTTLVRACRAGDAEAYRRMMETYGGAVRGLVASLLGDREEADAATQEAFFKAFRRLDTFKEGTNLKVWLLTIARNTAYDQLRRRRARPVVPVDLGEVAEPTATTEGPDENLERAEQASRVRAALSGLPGKVREVVYLRFFEEMTWDDIGKAVGVAEATARARVNSALERLRSAMS